MTILEAIKSGKPYKQPGDEEWISQHATTLTILVTAVEIGTGSLSIPEYIQKLKNGEYKTP